MKLYLDAEFYSTNQLQSANQEQANNLIKHNKDKPNTHTKLKSELYLEFSNGIRTFTD